MVSDIKFVWESPPHFQRNSTCAIVPVRRNVLLPNTCSCGLTRTWVRTILVSLNKLDSIAVGSTSRYVARALERPEESHALGDKEAAEEEEGQKDHIVHGTCHYLVGSGEGFILSFDGLCMHVGTTCFEGGMFHVASGWIHHGTTGQTK